MKSYVPWIKLKKEVVLTTPQNFNDTFLGKKIRHMSEKIGYLIDNKEL